MTYRVFMDVTIFHIKPYYFPPVTALTGPMVCSPNCSVDKMNVFRSEMKSS